MTTETDPMAAALVAALGELDNVTKDSTADAGTYEYAYASLGSVLAAARPVLARHGLALITPVETDERTVTIRAVFLHATGATFEAGALTLARGNSAQQLGSALSYGRRYCTLAALGLATEDDDGAHAATSSQPSPTPAPSREELADRARGDITFDRLKLLDAEDQAAARRLAADRNRRLTRSELRGFPAWRAEVDDLLAMLLEPTGTGDTPADVDENDETTPRGVDTPPEPETATQDAEAGQ